VEAPINWERWIGKREHLNTGEPWAKAGSPRKETANGTAGAYNWIEIIRVVEKA
jgi:hypothetical protein